MAAITILAYAAGVVGLLALRALLPLQPPALAALNYFMPYLFAPLLLTLPLALASRSQAAWAGSIVTVGFFLALYGPLFLPSFRSAPAPVSNALTVATFNLGAFRTQPEHLAQAIEGTRADIVAVQELVPATAAKLAEMLDVRYPYQVLDTGLGTSGLLSRYPILASEWFRPAGYGRAALQAVIDVDGAPAQIIVAHPEPPGIVRFQSRSIPVGVDDRAVQEQMADVARRAGALPGPVLVVGDFNMGEQSGAYAQLAATLHDSFREAGWGLGFTFPQGLQAGGMSIPGPLIRIDYVFHSSDLYAERATVGCDGGSDHCHLAVRLRWTRAARPGAIEDTQVSLSY